MAPDFQPGFRLDAKDIAVLLLGAGGVWLLLPVDDFLALVVGFAVGHFFLFCNVLRMARRFELAWATVFTVLSASTITQGQPGVALTVGGVLLTTLLVTILQMRATSYHGVGWKKLNPGLPAWWAARHANAAVDKVMTAKIVPSETAMTATQAPADLRPTLTPRQTSSWMAASRAKLDDAVREPRV